MRHKRARPWGTRGHIGYFCPYPNSNLGVEKVGVVADSRYKSQRWFCLCGEQGRGGPLGHRCCSEQAVLSLSGAPGVNQVNWAMDYKAGRMYHHHSQVPVPGIKMENTLPSKVSVGQGTVGQSSLQFGPVKFEVCVKHQDVLRTAGFLSLYFRGDLWAGDTGS